MRTLICVGVIALGLIGCEKKDASTATPPGNVGAMKTTGNTATSRDSASGAAATKPSTQPTSP